jgi:ribosome-binding protein aMBF1 (putative translation factor)
MSRRKLAETAEQVKDGRLLAVLVRSLRACAGWSQKELALQLDLSPASIAKLETGELRLNSEMMNSAMK